MKKRIKSRFFTPWAIVCAALMIWGCEGGEQRERVDDTVKTLSGQKSVEQMDQMKKDIDKIGQQHGRRLKQVDETSEN